MKFYRYPLAIVSYSLIAFFLIVVAWNKLGNSEMATYWYYFPAGAGFYLLISFILSKLKLHWEWDVAFQVGFVLAPVLWYVNIKEPYKRPVYVFVINSDYRGILKVNFNLEKNAPTNAHSTSDTLYFKFDEEGEILLNEESAYIKESMRKQLFRLYPDTRKVRVPFAEIKKLPSDTTQVVLVEDSIETDNGRMKVYNYRLDYPQHLK